MSDKIDPTSILTMQDLELTMQVALPAVFTIVRATIGEGLSEMAEAVVEIAVPNDLSLAEAVEQPAVLRLQSDVAPVREWTLMVERIELIGPEDSSLRYAVHLRPSLWFLRYTTDTRKYRNMSAQQIVSKIFDEHGVKHQWSLVRETETRKYCVQYRETCLDFVLRLLEFEGIHYDFAPDGTVTLGDRSQSLPDVSESSSFELIETGGAMTWKKTGLFRLQKAAKVASGAATTNDFNWKKPKVSLLCSAKAEEDAELEIYDYPVGYRRPDQGERLAQTRLEALRVPARNVRGEGNVASFTAGRHFTYVGLDVMAGRYLLQRVTHAYHNTKFVGGENDGGELVGYRNHFHAIPERVPFRPAVVTPHPVVVGSHTAMVRGPEGEEIHTDAHGRFRAQFHWDREAVGTDDDSRWLRNLQESQTGMVLARVGWEQSVAYIDGDPDRPTGFARNINGAMTPEYAQPANKTRMTMKSPSYPNKGGFNELRLDDLAGLQSFDWHAEKDLIGMVNNDRVENVGANDTLVVGDSRDHAVNNDQTWNIKGNFDKEIASNAPDAIDGNRDKSVGGNEKWDLGGNFAASCEKDETEKVTGTWGFEVGEGDGGSITRIANTKLNREVGASHTIKCDGNLSVRIEDEFTEKVGTDKITDVAEGSIGGTVTGKMTSTVTGNVTRFGDKGAGVGAKESTIDVTGAAAYTSGEKLTIRGNHIRLESKQSMSFSSAALRLELTPSQIAVKGKMKLESKTQIVTTGNPQNVTK